MRDFQGRASWRRWVYSRFMVGLLALLILILARPVWKIYRKSRAVLEERAQVAAQLAELESRKAYLEQEVARLKTERGVEGEIRKKFPVVKPGEKVIIVIEDESATSTATTSGGWLQKFEKWLETE